VRALGTPIKLGAATESSFQSGEGTARVEFSAPLLGRIDNGSVYVEGRWIDEGWDLEVWVTYLQDGAEQRMSIQRQMPR
jgi:hypothetical protein